tara:strand:- start:2133 stop:2534 length:402 start_codon:yes stop_codon:yes gene_type:complete
MLAALGPDPEEKSLSYRKKVYQTIPSRLLICESIYKKSSKAGLDPDLAISLAFHESGFTNTTNKKTGAEGPLQVIRKYTPKNLNPIDAGIYALKAWLKQKKDVCDAIAGYNGGNNRAKCNMWARSVLGMAKSL